LVLDVVRWKGVTHRPTIWHDPEAVPYISHLRSPFLYNLS
jgi:uncharacterized protein (DUF2342 family)